MTILKVGKMYEIADEMLKTQLQIIRKYTNGNHSQEDQ
jgi:hypothetical protein